MKGLRNVLFMVVVVVGMWLWFFGGGAEEASEQPEPEPDQQAESEGRGLFGPGSVEEVEPSGDYRIFDHSHPQGEDSAQVSVLVDADNDVQMREVTEAIVRDFYVPYSLVTVGVHAEDEDTLIARIVMSKTAQAEEITGVPEGEYEFTWIDGTSYGGRMSPLS